MKRIFGFLLIAVSLAACGDPSDRVSETGEPTHISNLSGVTVWTDPDSGCRYFLRTRHQSGDIAGGMTPVLRRDGLPDCPETTRR